MMADIELKLSEPGIFSEVLSIFFPVRCVHCGRGGHWLCQDCASGLKLIGGTLCRRCGRPVERSVNSCSECHSRGLAFHSAAAAFYFNGAARSLVHQLKYGGQRRLAGYLAEISADAAAGFIQRGCGGLTENKAGISLTFIPMHRSKQLNRGYNQARLYARALGRRLGLPVVDLLLKNRPTAPQNQLDFDARGNNLTGSFSFRRGASITGERIILIDDVYTTGATARECARIINEALGVNVYIWTFARTVRNRGSRTDK